MNDRDADPPGESPSLVPAFHLTLHAWLFRGTVVLLAYGCAALCCWLIKGSARPFLEALAPAVGVALGFALLRWMELHAEHHGERRDQG